jgi:hypothetical protein
MSWTLRVAARAAFIPLNSRRWQVFRHRGGETNFHQPISTNMKSAYELAMERLQKQAPATQITEKQKKKLAELDDLYKAKRAEREVFLEGEIAKARAQGDGQAYEQLQQQLRHDLRRLEEELEAKKEKVRAGK